MTAPELCTVLDWDSAFFGRTIARLHATRLDAASLAAAQRFCAEAKVDCLYFLADADHAESVRLAQAAGFDLVDVKVTLDGDLTRLAPPPEAGIRPFVPADVDALAAIARRSHVDSRFYYDGRFARARCDDFYETWIRNSCAGWARCVLVAGEPGRPTGYISVHLDDDGVQAHIGLIAVADDAQGGGVGRRLIAGALAWMRAQGRQRAWVVTQGRNARAQRAYQRCGLTTREVALWFHLWPRKELSA
jgi:RimJ/RimL family protein N-acetyltransferase